MVAGSGPVQVPWGVRSGLIVPLVPLALCIRDDDGDRQYQYSPPPQRWPRHGGGARRDVDGADSVREHQLSPGAGGSSGGMLGKRWEDD
jgi:hypothetical protein